MRSAHREHRSSTLIPLAIALPLTLLAAALLPGTVNAALPTGVAGQSPRGTGGNVLVRSGNGSQGEAPAGQFVDLSISPSEATVVSGGTLALSAVVAPLPGVLMPMILSYAWTLSNDSVGFLVPTDLPQVEFNAGAVLAPVTLEATVQIQGFLQMGSADLFFEDQASASITIAPPLAATPLEVSPDPAIPGEPVTLTTDVTGGIPGYTTLFDFGDGGTLQVETSAPGPVSVTHAYAEGTYQPSTSTSSFDGESVEAGSESSVVVTPQLGVSIDLPVAADQSTPFTVQASVGGGSPPYTFSWENSWGGAQYGSSSWTLSPSRTGPVTFSLTVTDADGQTAVAPAASLTVAASPTLTVGNAMPIVDVGTPLPLELSVSGGSGPFQVSWTPGPGASTLTTELPADGTFDEPYVFDTPGQIWTTASLTDAVGAIATDGAVTGRVVSLPTLSLTASPSVATVADPVVLMSDVAGGVPPYHWDWEFSGPVSTSSALDGTLPGAGSIVWNGTLASPESLVASLGLTDASGGSVSAVLDLTVESPLGASLGASQGRGEVGDPFELLADVNGGQPPYSLTLTASDGEVAQSQIAQAGITELPLVPRVPGNLTVQLQVEDQLGRTYLASMQVPVAPVLSTQLTLTRDPIDTGSTSTAQLTIQGGWPPYSGNVADSDGQSFPFQTSATSVSIPLGPCPPGALELRSSTSDSFGSSSTAQAVLRVSALPQLDVDLGTSQTDVGVPVEIAVSATGGSGSFPYLHVLYGDGNSTSSWSSAHAYARPGSYVLNATVTDSSGGQASSPPMHLTVAPLPSAVASLGAVGADVGLGAAFSSQVQFGTAPFTYLWDFGDGAQSEEADPTHVYAAPGLYRVQLTVVDATGEEVVAPLLNVTVSSPAQLSATVNRTSVEEGIDVSFSAQVLGGAAPFSVLWSFGDGSSASGLVVNHTFDSSGLFSVVAQLHDGAGGAASATVTLPVAPVLQVAPVAAPLPGAEVGAPVTLTDVPAGGVGPYQMQWQLGSTQGAGVDLTSWTFVPRSPGLLSGTLQVTDSQGARAYVDFQLFVVPAISLNLTASPAVPEAGEPFQLTAGAWGGVGPVSFSWVVPPGIPSPGNRSLFIAQVSTPGAYPLTVQATDANGRQVVASLDLEVAPPLSIVVGPASWTADQGLPVPFSVSVEGGVGPVMTTAITPFGSFSLSGAPIIFPTIGTYPVRLVAEDQDGAIAEAQGNLTVVPPPSLELVEVHEEVAAGDPEIWSAAVLGGSPPSTVTWDAVGVGSWTGAQVNITLPTVGTYEVVVTSHDAVGGVDTRDLNVTAVSDDLTVELNESSQFGIAPFEPSIFVTMRGGTGPAVAQLFLDDLPWGAPSFLVPGTPWVVPMDLGAGVHTLRVEVTDALGAQAESSVQLEALPPLSLPEVDPASPVVTAGQPLPLTASLSGENVTGLPGEVWGLTWWGPGVRSDGPGQATFLSDHAGPSMVMVSATVSVPGVPDLQNTTLPVVVQVQPAAAVCLGVEDIPTTEWAGENATAIVAAEDAYGNLVPAHAGNISWEQVAPSATGRSLASLPLEAGLAELELSSTRAVTADYLVASPGLENASFEIDWTANPSRAVLKLTSWERTGSSLLLNISASDVFGNPLTNLTVTVEVPGGPSITGTVVDGNLSLILPQGAEATSVEILGPDGAETTASLVGTDGPSPDPLGTIASLAFIAGLLITGILLGRRYRRRRARAARDTSDVATVSPSVFEAKGALEDIVEHLPGEDRESLLLLAEEHGIPRKEAEEALLLLEKDRRVERKPDAEGVERFELRAPSRPTSEEEEVVEGGPSSSAKPEPEVRP